MSNPTAGQVAAELRRIADSFDREPNTVVGTPMVSFHCNDYIAADKGKSVFLNVARILPRPLVKVFGSSDVELRNPDTSIVRLWAAIDRNSICELVAPAKPAEWRCAPLLSPEEESTLEQS